MLTCGKVQAHEQPAIQFQELTSHPLRSVSQDVEAPEQCCTEALCPVVPLAEPENHHEKMKATILVKCLDFYCRIRGSSSGEYDNGCHLGCNAM